jgi:hypothetical protein
LTSIGKNVSQPTENQRFHPSIEWPFKVRLCRNIVTILSVSQHQRETCQLPSMNPPCSRSTLWRVPLHQGLQLCLIFFSPFEINEVCIVLEYPDE